MNADTPDSDMVREAAEARERVARGGGRVHAAGVCGIGMAGLAYLLSRRGLDVNGCDSAVKNAGGEGGQSARIAAWLRAHGIAVAAGHDAAHVAAGVDWVVRSAAVPEDSPEILAARAAGVPVLRRGAVLPALLGGRRSVAVSGTHGKTTTTAFLAQILTFAGREPAFCIGGEVDALGGVAGAGRDEILVVEADESDGTVALYEPEIAIITNVEFDHMEHFADVEAFEACFRSLARRTRGRIIYGADDPRAARLCGGLANGRSFGAGPGAFHRAEGVREDAAGLHFTWRAGAESLGALDLPVRGRHNVLNALAAAAAALDLGLAADEIRAGLARVALPRRRLERVAGRDGVTVISDYAHHPTEVAALVRAARSLGHARVLAVFQPHRYTRTKALGADFPAAFAGVEDVVLLPVYAASEAPIPGGAIGDLYAHFRERGGPPALLASSRRQAWDYTAGRLRAGDLFLVVGAGDVEAIALMARDAMAAAGPGAWGGGALRREMASDLALRDTVVREAEPLAPKTTLRVGGGADLWMEIGLEGDLAQAVAWCGRRGVPFRVLGGGSNTLVSDLGVRGVTARLAGAAFRGVRREGGLLVCGAAAPLARALAEAEREGLAGLEFLEGIPGSAGGAARMNAGAWGEEIGGRVAWVRSMDREGRERRREGAALGFSYRSCAGLAEEVVLEVALRVEPAADAGAIRARREEHAERRRWMQGLHSAGSVFRNPPGRFAGQLIEAAGWKGRRIGGASISERHANVIVTEEGARASDVLALAWLAQAAVQAASGIRLELEISVME